MKLMNPGLHCSRTANNDTLTGCDHFYFSVGLLLFFKHIAQKQEVFASQT
jgi:hypothetical protein